MGTREVTCFPPFSSQGLFWVLAGRQVALHRWLACGWSGAAPKRASFGADKGAREWLAPGRRSLLILWRRPCMVGGVSYTTLAPKYHCLPTQALGEASRSPGSYSSGQPSRGLAVTGFLPGSPTLTPRMLYRSLWRTSRVVPREYLEGNSLAGSDKLHYGGNGTQSNMDGLLLIH